MNCEKFKEIAPELARQEIMETGVRNSALAHVQECGSCRHHWDAERTLSDNLRLLSRKMNSLPGPAHLEGALLAAFRNRANVAPLRREPRRWRYWAAAIAAVLLIGIAVSAWRAGAFSSTRKEQQAGSSPKPEHRPAPQPAPPQPLATVNNTGSEATQPKPAPRPRVKTNRETASTGRSVLDSASAVAVNNETKEVTSDFVALGYGNAMDLQDGGQLVRVELPRAALARFGLLLDMDHADERVKADVLVGTDGLARAIRFVK